MNSFNASRKRLFRNYASKDSTKKELIFKDKDYIYEILNFINIVLYNKTKEGRIPFKRTNYIR